MSFVDYQMITKYDDLRLKDSRCNLERLIVSIYLVRLQTLVHWKSTTCNG